MTYRKILKELTIKNLHLPEILLLSAAVFLYRVVSDDVFGYHRRDLNIYFLEFLFITLGNVPLTISILWADIAVAKSFNHIKWFSKHVILRLISELTYLATMSATGAIIVNLSTVRQIGLKLSFESERIAIQFFSILVISTAVYYLTNVILYYRGKQRAELREQITRRNHANYQYSRLKHQLNPHFLFNSLNVLDYLVQTDPDRASRFIGKLAEVYRYQLNQEQKNSVPLNQEIRFVESYYELLRERFGQAIIMTINITPEHLNRYRIVPCALQLLVENAAKHNSLSAENPLHIKIFVADHHLCTVNNLQPKITQKESWGIGLNSIKTQYQSLFSQEVTIRKTQTKFIVELPLIEI